MRALNRRGFLSGVPMSVLAAATIEAAPAGDTTPPRYDFDTPYNRIGTDSVKWDQPARIFGRENIAVGMGVADMDFRAAPCVTNVLKQRVQHENWGYLDMPRSFRDAIIHWNQTRYGIGIDPELLVLTVGVHAGIVAAL